jgi:hypothetical protein
MGRLATRAMVVGLVVASSLVWSASASTSSRGQSSNGLLSVVCPSPRSCTALGYHAGRNLQSPRVFAGAGRWGTGTTLRLPANSSSPGARFDTVSDKSPNWVNVHYSSMSCPSAGNCAVAGAYSTNGGSRGVLLSEVNGRWTRGIERPLPADALKLRPPLELNSAWTSVSCGSAGNCTAIGFYWNHGAGDAGVQGLLVTELNGTWGRSVKAPLPVDAYTPNPLNPGGGVELESVSCATAGNCTAVGSYRDAEVRLAGALLTQTNGEWARGVRARLPVGIRARAVTLQAVSCASPGNCTAVGRYNQTPRPEGLLVTQTDGKWATGIMAPLPADHATQQFTPYAHLFLNSVSCSSPGNCTAVGDYVARGGHQRGLMLTQTDGIWAKGAEASVPAGAWRTGIGPAATLKSVSCSSPGNCTAVGVYWAGRKVHRVFPLVLTERHGHWAKAVAVRLPAGAAPLAPNTASGPEYAQAGLFSVSCASAGNCTAVGQYPHTTRLGYYWGLRVTQSNGRWGKAVWVKG